MIPVAIVVISLLDYISAMQACNVRVPDPSSCSEGVAAPHYSSFNSKQQQSWSVAISTWS